MLDASMLKGGARPRLRFGTWVPAVLVVAAGVWVLFAGRHRRPAGEVPRWPLHAGDVLTLAPGDANITKWAQNPLSMGFVVRQLRTDGRPVEGASLCAFEPDYMADAGQPGGRLTILEGQEGGDWKVRWTGGATVPPFLRNRGGLAANCGGDAVVLMRSRQLHSLRDILAGVADSAPPAGSAASSGSGTP